MPAMARAIREFLLAQEAEQPVVTVWINPRCGYCDVGHFAYQPSTAALHCTSPVCNHWILPRELVDADGWEIRDGILAVPN